MSASIILYGSRARGDARPNSDMDLLVAEDGNGIGNPNEVCGISVHLYSKGWLLQEARQGNLFAYHVGHEGASLYDPENFLGLLKSNFLRKISYEKDIELASRVLQYLLRKNWILNDKARRRYFWSLRTILICSSAEYQEPVFSSYGLELFSGIAGLKDHVDNRDGATFSDCSKFGYIVLEKYAASLDELGDELRSYLLKQGNIAADTVRVIEEREAIEVGDMLTYL